jgi:hypothetical protein
MPPGAKDFRWVRKDKPGNERIVCHCACALDQYVEAEKSLRQPSGSVNFLISVRILVTSHELRSATHLLPSFQFFPLSGGLCKWGEAARRRETDLSLAGDALRTKVDVLYAWETSAQSEVRAKAFAEHIIAERGVRHRHVAFMPAEIGDISHNHRHEHSVVSQRRERNKTT